MPTKLCPHIQILDSRTLAAIERVQPPMVKTMDLNHQSLQRIRQAAPGALLVARAFADNQDYSDPVAAAESHAERYRSVLDMVDVVEVFNEAVNNTSDMSACRRFDQFQVEFAHRIWRMKDDVKIGLFCLPTGNFGYPGEPALTPTWFPQSLYLPAERVFICLHEYSWYTWDWESPARCLRYRRLMDWGKTLGLRVLITECGLTQAVLPGKPDIGWRSGISRDVYVNGAAWYDSELQKDDYIVGAAMFTCGASYGWDSFECTAEWEEAAQASASPGGETTQPLDGQYIRVLLNGRIYRVELEEYLRGVVLAEMPASWPLEALKAQAVAARSYALWRIRNPRDEDFDIYGTSEDQVWDASARHGRTDAAVRETAGIALDRPTLYVSKCGRVDCPYCQGQGGFDGKTWNDRMCQFGAKAMAESGATWREILLHYYGQSPGKTYIRPASGTRRGLHWTPVMGHTHSDLTYFIDRCRDMKLGWVTLLDDGGGSTLQPNPFYGGRSIVDMFLERDIVPIIRIFAAPWAKFDARFEDTARRLVERGVRYVFWMNEPECPGEWASRGGSVPKTWVRDCTRLFVDGAYKMLSIGAYPGWWATTTFRWVDEQGVRVNPFLAYMSEQERRDIFIEGHGWVPLHNYPKNKPIDAPEDAVNQTGRHLTHEEYLAKLEEVDPTYRATRHLWVWDDYQVSEHHINLLRDRGVHPGQTIEDDDVCFRMYRGMNRLLEEAGLLPYVPIISTEIGPCVGERDDGRYPRVTPQEQIRMIRAMLAEASIVPNYLGMTFWLAGVQRLDAATADGFEDQGWWTDRHNEPFNLKGELPIVSWLIEHDDDGGEDDMTENTPPELDNDAAAYGVYVEPAVVAPGEAYWKVTRVHHLTPAENNGNHNVYVNVLRDGQPARDVKVEMFWPADKPNSATIFELTKPYPDEPMGNAPLYRGQVVGLQVVSELSSDRVMNIHTSHPDEPPSIPGGPLGNTNGHHSFLVEWRLVTHMDEPEEVTEQDIRNAAWNRAFIGPIAYNPEAAFQAEARELGLGVPVTNEFDIGPYRVQGYAGGILYARIGEWQNIVELEW